MTKQEYLMECKNTIRRNGAKAKLIREIWDTRFDYRTQDEWFIYFTTEKQVENLYEQYAEAPMIKVKYIFTTMS